MLMLILIFCITAELQVSETFLASVKCQVLYQDFLTDSPDGRYDLQWILDSKLCLFVLLLSIITRVLSS